MDVISMLALAVGLSMDAFAAAVGKGLSIGKFSAKKAAVVGIWFGGFQALMPIIGYLLGTGFRESITAVDHWIAFGLLGLMGLHMIWESQQGEKCACPSVEAAEGNSMEEEKLSAEAKAEGISSGKREGSLKAGEMFVLALATSIDALAVGVTFAFLDVDPISSSLFIGTVTFVLSIAGVKVGNVFGAKYKSKAECAGGILLVLLGIKILLEHTGVL